MKWLSITACIFLLAGCGASEPAPKAEVKTVEIEIPRPRSQVPETNAPAVTKGVVDKVARLLEITANGQITPLIREAEKNPDFQSNFGGQSHSRHWSLLRRIGIDPVQNLRDILNEPYDVKRVGNEDWFIWPDFAAHAPEELIPEGLSFLDRARLRTLIGEDGIDRIRAGEPYPGVRLAISGTGRWVYFIHDIETSEDENNGQ